MQVAEHKNVGNIKNLQERKGNAFRSLDDKKRRLILSEEFVNHYIKVFEIRDYYLSTDEIRLGAILFNKKNVQIVNDKFEPTERVMNPDNTSATIYIHHRGNHFSRCFKTETRIPENASIATAKIEKDTRKYTDIKSEITTLIEEGKRLIQTADKVSLVQVKELKSKAKGLEGKAGNEYARVFSIINQCLNNLDEKIKKIQDRKELEEPFSFINWFFSIPS